MSDEVICYFSATLDSKIEVVPVRLQSHANKLLVEFSQKYPEYADLFSYIGDNYLYTYIEDYIEAFNR